MASAILTFRVSPCFGINPKLKPRFRAERLVSGDDNLSVYSVNGGAGSVMEEKEKKGSFLNGGNGRLKPRIEQKMVKKRVCEELEVLWDDGYGTKTVKDYLIAAEEMIKPDGGPPRWFCPVECGQPINDSPLLLFLPGKFVALFLFDVLTVYNGNFILLLDVIAGLDGVGMGLILHHKALGK